MSDHIATSDSLSSSIAFCPSIVGNYILLYLRSLTLSRTPHTKQVNIFSSTTVQTWCEFQKSYSWLLVLFDFFPLSCRITCDRYADGRRVENNHISSAPNGLLSTYVTCATHIPEAKVKQKQSFFYYYFFFPFLTAHLLSLAICQSILSFHNGPQTTPPRSTSVLAPPPSPSFLFRLSIVVHSTNDDERCQRWAQRRVCMVNRTEG